MTRPVDLSAEAEQDLADVRDWYEKQRAGLGVVFLGRVSKTLSRIGANPELYGYVHDPIRAAPIERHQHLVFYRVFPDRVEVVAVLHGSRDPAVWQGRI